MQVKLWRCFLQGAANRLRHQYVRARTADVTRIDAAKLACCFRAATDRCRQLCHQVRVCVWASVRERISETACPIYAIFLCMLPMAPRPGRPSAASRYGMYFRFVDDVTCFRGLWLPWLPRWERANAPAA